MTVYARLPILDHSLIVAHKVHTIPIGFTTAGEISITCAEAVEPLDDPDARGTSHTAPIKPHIELFRGTAKVAEITANHLSYMVPPSPLTPAAPHGPDWHCTITNPGPRSTQFDTEVMYPSWRELGVVEIPMRLFEAKLRQILTPALAPGQVPPVALRIDYQHDPFAIGADQYPGDTNYLFVDLAQYVTDATGRHSMVLPIGNATKDGKKLKAISMLRDGLSVSVAAALPPGRNEAAPRLRLALRFEDGGPREIEKLGFLQPDVDLADMVMTIDLYLRREPTGVEGQWMVGYQPAVEFAFRIAQINNLPDGLAIKSATEQVKRGFEQAVLGKLKAKVGTLGPLLTKLFVDGDLPILAVAVRGDAIHVEYAKPPTPDRRDLPASTEPRVEAGPDTSAALLSKIDHIVVLMMENRSFDHMLGYLKRDAGWPIEGPTGAEVNTYASRDFRPFPLPTTHFAGKPDHSHAGTLQQVANGMGGFVANYAKEYPDSAGDVMGYYRAPQVPTYDQLAHQFAICDHWFSSHPGPTFNNRYFGVSGHLPLDSHGVALVEDPGSAMFGAFDGPTIFHHLDAANVSWRYYEDDICFARLLPKYRFDDTHVVPVRDPARGLFADAAAGRLPSVAFVDPNFMNVPGVTWNDDHPPADVADGQNLVASIYNALAASPQWGRTMFVITYDEHGGFFDHVTPPPTWGVRVPAFVVSPWVEPGHIIHEPLEHTALLQTIIRRFLRANPPRMSDRQYASRDLGVALTRSVARSATRAELPSQLPVTAVPTALAARRPATPPDPSEFHEKLRVFRDQLVRDRAARTFQVIARPLK